MTTDISLGVCKLQYAVLSVGMFHDVILDSKENVLIDGCKSLNSIGEYIFLANYTNFSDSKSVAV